MTITDKWQVTHCKTYSFYSVALCMGYWIHNCFQQSLMLVQYVATITGLDNRLDFENMHMMPSLNSSLGFKTKQL